MTRLLSIVLALMLAPTLVVASPGGFRCQDGIVRPKCCCPKAHAESARHANCPSVRKPQCCDIVPGAASILPQGKSDVQRFRVVLDATAVPFRLPKVVYLPIGGDNSVLPEERPPPGCPTFLRHLSLLI